MIHAAARYEIMNGARKLFQGQVYDVMKSDEFLARCMVVLPFVGRGIGFLRAGADLNVERQESFSRVEMSLWVCRIVNCPHVLRIQIPE